MVRADGVATALLTVRLLDALGNPVPGQPVQLTSSGPASDRFAPSMGVTDAAGIFTATLAATLAEDKTIQAIAGGITLSTTVLFVAGPAAQLTFTVQPTDAIAGVGLSPDVRVAVLDSQNNLVTASTNTVQLGLANNPSGAILSGSTSAITVTGVASFAGLRLYVVGVGYTLAASSTGLAGATSAPFTVSAASPAAFTSTLSAAPGSVIADGFSTSALTLTLRDAFGNPIPGASVAWSSSGGASDMLTPAGSVTDAAGRLSATIASTLAGADVVTVTIGSIALHVTVQFN